MKNFKRFTALFLAMLMLFSLAACGNSTTSDKSTEEATTSAFDIMSQFNEIGKRATRQILYRQKAEEKKRMARIEGYMVRLCKVAWILENFDYIYNKT